MKLVGIMSVLLESGLRGNAFGRISAIVYYGWLGQNSDWGV